MTVVPYIVPEHGPSTTTTLAYFAPPADGQRPFDRLYPSDEPETNVVYQQFPRSKLLDLRPLVDTGRTGETDVNVTGFQVLDSSVAKTEMREEDFNNDSTVRGQYYDETIALIKKVTGASRVVIFDHTIRRSPVKGAAPIADTPETRLPVSRVHIDQTPASGEARVRRHTGEDAERLLKGRCQLINLWRPLRQVLEAPLAVADARSLANSDLVKSRLLYAAPTPEGETFQVSYSQNHRWYYLSNMVRDEALMLQCWTNGKDGGARTPHSGVLDDAWTDRVVEKGKERQSIEVRALVFFENE